MSSEPNDDRPHAGPRPARRETGQGGTLIPLVFLGAGQSARVENFTGGWGLVSRLASMGMREGSVVRVISVGPGPVIVCCGETRLALGHGMAGRIMVSPVVGGSPPEEGPGT